MSDINVSVPDITFSGATLFTFFFVAAFNFLIPTVAMVWWYKRTKCAIFPVFIGFVTYFCVSWIRAAFRAMLLTDSLKETAWMFFLVSALLSGVLEEIGRYVAMRYVMYDRYDDWKDAVTYGIGHCACESMFGVAPQAFGHFLIGLDCNKRGAAALITSATPEGIQNQIDQLKSHADTGLLEVLSELLTLGGLIPHIALSVLVFISVHYVAKKKFFYISMALHTLLDFIPYLISTFAVLAVFCLIPWIFDIILAVFVYRLYKKIKREEDGY